MAEPDDDWRTWLDRHGPALVLLARQFVHRRADAEDVVQEAFIRFWKTRESVEQPAAFLYSCVKRCALDWNRGRRRRTQREEVAARPEAESLFVGRPEQDERRAAIEAALGELPTEQVEVLVMKTWGGLTFVQIAAALEIPINTAASRYRYALSKLREALAGKLAEEPSYD